MKNKSIALMLALAGLVGCRGNGADNANSDSKANGMALTGLFKNAEVQKQPVKDTAYVLGCKSLSSVVYMSVVDKSGNVFVLREKFNEKSIGTNVGDTVIVSQIDRYGARALSRNLTMENKIQKVIDASKQR